MSSTNDPSPGRSPEELMAQVRYLEAEVSELRGRLAEAPGGSRSLELRLADTQRSLAAVSAQNDRLAQTLREARDQITKLKEEVDRLAQPPAGFGTFLARHEDDSVDVFTGGRKLRVHRPVRVHGGEVHVLDVAGRRNRQPSAGEDNPVGQRRALLVERQAGGRGVHAADWPGLLEEAPVHAVDGDHEAHA